MIVFCRSLALGGMSGVVPAAVGWLLASQLVDINASF